jgi:S1-C subfamily serine protease
MSTKLMLASLVVAVGFLPGAHAEAQWVVVDPDPVLSSSNDWDTSEEFAIRPDFELPQLRLGFNGRYNGRGMQILSVNWGSLADRIGLERGDVIESVNGQRITGYRHYLHLLNQSGDFLTLTVRDVRTGRLMTTTLVLGFNPDGLPSWGGPAIR